MSRLFKHGEEPDSETEIDGVVMWRFEQLVKAGFTPDDAMPLAESDVDWHEAARLLRRGWTSEQVKAALV